MKKKGVLCLFGLIFLGNVFLSQDLLIGAETLRITDLAGRQVSVPDNPSRIIGLGPGALRLILYLEGKSRVVGVEDIERQNPTTRPYWIAHSDLARLPSVGPGGPSGINKEPDLEKIMGVKPEVIFITYMDRDKADQLEKKLGIPVVVLSYGPFAAFDEIVYESLRLCGKILHKSERAETVIRYIEGVRGDLRKRVERFPTRKKPSVYVGGIGYRGTQAIESTETEYIPFEWVGAQAVVKGEGKKGHLFVEKEKLLQWNPDIIFLDSGGLERIREDYQKKPTFYQGLQAFRTKRLYILHAFNWYTTNIETVLVDAYAVGKVLYPEAFRDVVLAAKADEIYRFFLGKPIFGEMEKYHGKLLGLPAFLR